MEPELGFGSQSELELESESETEPVVDELEEESDEVMDTEMEYAAS